METVLMVVFLLIFIITVVVRGLALKYSKIRAIGVPAISKVLLKIGKLSLFINLVFILVQNQFYDVSLFAVHPVIRSISIILFGFGVFLHLLSSIHLGLSYRMGLPMENTSLKTNGIYRFSRNPMILSLYFIAIASCMYVANPFNWIAGLTVLFVHHKIVLAEEVFLRDRFGEQWSGYQRMTRRYL